MAKKTTKYAPGGDQQAIAKIANEIYGGYPEMFEAHGWDWPGSKAMALSSKLIKDYYGSIEAFEAYRSLDNLPEDPFADNPSIWIKAFHGFHPPSWACVGWKSETRLNTVKGETSSPFIMVIWVTESAPKHDKRLRGRIAGFYELSHETGRRAEFMEPWQDARHEKGKWEHSFRARRAWKILPEFMPKLKDFHPDVIAGKRSQATGNWSEPLPQESIEKLKALPRVEVPVFGVKRNIDPTISVLSSQGRQNRKGYVRGGTSNQSGYYVPPEQNSKKSLYILKLKGDASVWLDDDVAGQNIYKVGLSISPQTRCDCFNYGMPDGAFSWVIDRTTVMDEDDMYPDFKTAEAGEMAMKKHLGADESKHLGGEFYLADLSTINKAWGLGRDAALAEMRKSNG